MIPMKIRGTAVVAERPEDRISLLVANLASPDPVVRTKAREALVAIGKARKPMVASRKLTVPFLIQLLSHRKSHVRWEAAKALVSIANPIAAFALVNALDDRDGDVRWLASQGIVALGQEGLHPLLAALLERAGSIWVCEGAHHVCHTLVKRKKLGPILRPVLAALNQSEPQVAAPLAAYIALARLRELS